MTKYVMYHTHRFGEVEYFLRGENLTIGRAIDAINAIQKDTIELHRGDESVRLISLPGDDEAGWVDV